MKAGRLEIEIVAEIARLQQDLDKAKRAVNAASGDFAKSARAANDNIAKMGNSSKLAGHHMANLSFQLQDIAIGLQGGQKPMTVFLQQGSQIAQIAAQSGVGLGGMAKAVASMIAGLVAAHPLMAALAVATAGAFVAFQDFRSTVNEKAAAELQAYAASLGLTKKQIEEAGGAAVTSGDMLLGLWDMFKEFAGVEKIFSDVKGWIVDNIMAAVLSAKKNISEIYAAIAATVDGIKHVWKNVGPIIGEAVIAGANAAIGAVESLINSSIDSLNALMLVVNPMLVLAKMAGFDVGQSHIKLDRIKNIYAGAGGAAADAFLGSYQSHLKKAEGAFDAGLKNWADAGVNRAKGRLSAAGEEAGKTVGSKAGKAAGREMADKMAESFADRFPAILKDVLKWAETPIKIESGLGDFLKQKEADRRLEEEQNEKNRARAIDAAHDIADIIGGRIGQVINELASVLDRAAAIFKSGSGFEKILAGAGIGGIAGSAAGSSLGGTVGGSIGGKLGEKFLGKLGDFAGPLGAIAGGLIGGIIGGLLKKTPKASATVSIIAGEAMDVAITGNKARLKQIAGGMANSLIDSLAGLAEQFGAELGNASVSVGMRKKNYVVDPTGQGRTKGAGVINFGKDEAAALEYAMRDAISDGVFEGLSAGIERLLKGEGDLQGQLQKALSLQSVMTEASRISDPTGAALAELDKWRTAMLKITTEAGEGAVEVEAVYASRRAEVIAQAAKDAFEAARPARELEIQIMELEGKSAEALAAARQLEKDGAEESLRALLDRKYALEDEAAAAIDAANAAAELARANEELAAAQRAMISERDGLLAQIDQVLGDTAAIRERERNALDEANRFLYDHLQLLKEQAAATEAATKAAEEAAAAQRQVEQDALDRLRSVVAKQRDLQIELAEVYDPATAEMLRQTDALKALDPALRGLQQQVWDARAAADAAAKAEQELTAAREEAARIAEQRRGLEIQLADITNPAVAEAMRRADTLASIADPVSKALQQQIFDAQDAKKAAEEYAEAMQAQASMIADARNVLADAYNRESSALKDTISRFSEFAKSIREFRAGLIGESNPGLSLGLARNKFVATSRSAGMGNEGALSAFTGDAQGYLDAAKNFGTFDQYQQALASVLSGSNSAIRYSDGMASQAQRQLDALDQQVSGIIDLNEKATTVAEALDRYNASISAEFPAIGETITAGIDSLNATISQSNAQAQETSGNTLVTVQTLGMTMSRIERLLTAVMENGNSLSVTIDNTTSNPVPVDQVA